MTKIRNTFTAGCKFGGYAGPADNGRGGSREKLSGFSGVSPPGITSRIINVIKKSLSVPLAAAVIVGKIFFTGAGKGLGTLAIGAVALANTACAEPEPQIVYVDKEVIVEVEKEVPGPTVYVPLEPDSEIFYPTPENTNSNGHMFFSYNFTSDAKIISYYAHCRTHGRSAAPMGGGENVTINLQNNTPSHYMVTYESRNVNGGPGPNATGYTSWITAGRGASISVSNGYDGWELSHVVVEKVKTQEQNGPEIGQ